ncbi:prolyl oligopeptidase family serine peptidase [Bifidobacterium sp. 64T4]|uniref:prolyl oligopeptidase family serine peptidase n=1 Tax=Bifidobacterium pongonis TaxID=2834432 RepID=UPI001C571CE1|nr:prolyl oligopeptidase family serine peptidase [Bifidobacterium pongonis]MBW3094396.1 prolyl oligopeptidase family serine peptidase [Bifidobacterium pongonis]
MNEHVIDEYPRLKARTLRFTCGAPRSANVIGDGSRALFLRSDGPEDTVTSLWMSWFDTEDEHHETLIADPRVLLGDDADSENVPAEERARRERAREGGSGIVGYSADESGSRVVFTLNGRLFLAELDDVTEGGEAAVRELCAGRLTAEAGTAPVLNPRISPDGEHVLYTTGERLQLVSIQPWDEYESGEADGNVTLLTASVETDDEADDADDSDDVMGGADEADDTDGTEPGAHQDPHPAENTWKVGLAEFVAGEEMDRYDGFWWAPDSRQIIVESFDTAPEPMWYISDPANPGKPAEGRRYPRALTANADVHLDLLRLDFDSEGRHSIVAFHEIEWDRETYEYVARVVWQKDRCPLLLVQNRRQTRDQVLAVDENGATYVLEEHANDQWIDIVDGLPALTSDGRLICALNDMDTNTNRLTVDGKPFTPAGWNVRGVLDVTDGDVLCVVQRDLELAPDVPQAWQETADLHDARCHDVVSIDYTGDVRPMVGEPGVWTASRGTYGEVVSGGMMGTNATTMIHVVHVAAATTDSGESDMRSVAALIANNAADPGFLPNTSFATLPGSHHLLAAITMPSETSPYAHANSLPVLVKPYGGPGFQQVVFNSSFYWDAQWWADQGFIVLTADGRGTTGRGPKWDREMFEDMKGVSLADQIEAVRALPELDWGDGPQPDLDKVAMIGWSFGGFLSALAVLDAPDVFHAACAGAPPTDWTLYDTHYTERYLGLDPEVYERNSIVADAPKLTRPLMLIHGFADGNVTIAHSLRLSQALMAAGRQHTFLPLTGITHMTNDETVAENLLLEQRDFLRQALALDAE